MAEWKRHLCPKHRRLLEPHVWKHRRNPVTCGNSGCRHNITINSVLLLCEACEEEGTDPYALCDRCGILRAAELADVGRRPTRVSTPRTSGSGTSVNSHHHHQHFRNPRQYQECFPFMELAPQQLARRIAKDLLSNSPSPQITAAKLEDFLRRRDYSSASGYRELMRETTGTHHNIALAVMDCLADDAQYSIYVAPPKDRGPPSVSTRRAALAPWAIHSDEFDAFVPKAEISIPARTKRVHRQRRPV
eukprot:NODE_1036_length_1148_cov_449.727025_g788_i0.p1 GENE.NODE_1036_length_1148_cov_449.727025_g788_i0~~NODE_1036_length_1148_cov_449.727025_g788_i0.p1  ORF type:complete len:247 (-),score=37.30 NODE_1036_length_1148_cov_449.727025_g788_i0:339-1079(-)